MFTGLAAGALTGCVTPQTCVSWVDFETPQAAYDDAGLVVRGDPGDVVGVRAVFGVASPVHRVEVAEVLKGVDPGATIDVAAVPLTCMADGEEFPEGDPLDVDGELILFLYREPDGWRLITPFDGVLPVPDDGVLPFEVETR